MNINDKENSAVDWELKTGLAKMLKGGVIMDVVSPEQAKIAQQAGGCAIMVLERVPADIRAAGGVARMVDPQLIASVAQSVSIPVMAKCRIGHTVEAQILQATDVIDFIDESEVLTPADEHMHIDKHTFKAPFVCGAKDLSQALRRIAEGAAMIRTKGHAGTGNIVEAVKHMRAIQQEIQHITGLSDHHLLQAAQRMGVDYSWLMRVRNERRLPVVNFAAGGVATPADAALMMHLGAEGVFVGSGIFKSSDPQAYAEAMVQAVTYYQNPTMLCQIASNLGQPMTGLEIDKLHKVSRLSSKD